MIGPLHNTLDYPHQASKFKRSGLADWLELYFHDHGFLRIAFHNLYQIDKNMWRSNQPSPKQIEIAHKNLGIKTILNLRGPRESGGWQLEAEACDKMGIELVNFRVRSRAAPETEMLLKLPELFSSIQHPTLLHCKSGADRAGLMSALYVLMVMKQPAIEALKQLSFKYLHVKQAKTGILDAFIASYIPFESQGMEFMRWVEEVYEPEKLVQEFKAQPLATRFVDSILKRE